MKKAILLLIIGILVFSVSGIGTVTSYELSTPQKLQPDVKILDIIGGLIRVEATIKNVGDEYAVIDSVIIDVDAPIMLIGRNTHLTVPVGLDPGITIAIVSDRIFGLGSCTITYELNIRYHGSVTATAKGFVFGPYIHIKEVFSSI